MEEIYREQQFFRHLICNCIEYAKFLRDNEHGEREKQYFEEKVRELERLLQHFDRITAEIIEQVRVRR